MHQRLRKPRRIRLVCPPKNTALKTNTNATIVPKTPGRPKKTGKASTQPSRTSSRLRRQQASASPAPAVPAPPAATPLVVAPPVVAPVVTAPLVIAPVDENENEDEDEDVDA